MRNSIRNKIQNWLKEYELEKNITDLIQEFRRYGWVSRDKKSNDLCWTDDISKKYVNAFLSVSRFFEFHEIEYADCPCYFSIAQPNLTSKSVQQFSAYVTIIQNKTPSGSAFTKRQAIESCLGEAIETLSLVRTGNEDLVYESYNNLSNKALHPNQVIQYSKQQYENRRKWNKNHLPQHHIPEPFSDDTVIAWAKLKHLSDNQEILYPAKLLCWGFEYEQPNYCNANSNGCAVAETEEQAQHRATLELIERDAAALWWYGQIQTPGIPHDFIEDTNVLNLIAWLKKLNRSVEILDITSDLEIPVVAVVSFNNQGKTVATGYACSYDIQEAISHAATEMMQMTLSIVLLEQRLESFSEKPPTDDELEYIRWVKEVNTGKFRHLVCQGSNALFSDSCNKPLDTNPNKIFLDFNNKVNNSKMFVKKCNQVIDNFSTVRVIIPELAGLSLQLARKRLNRATKVNTADKNLILPLL